MDPASPKVCEIPECCTTQSEIESELESYLAGFCSICRRERAGRLCGCAFPCALTFRAGMLNKIHDLLGIPKPKERRAIQVCFKHPDLLKQAREACLSQKNGGAHAAEGGSGSLQRTREASSSSSYQNGHHDDDANHNSTSRSDNALMGDVPSTGKMLKIQFGSMFTIGDEEEEEQSKETPQKSESVGKERAYRENEEEEMYDALEAAMSDHEMEEEEQEEEPKLQHNKEDKNNQEEEEEEVGSDMFNIRFQDYAKLFLVRNLRPLAFASFLSDVRLVCKGGSVCASGLLLGSLSPMLRSALLEVPPVDKEAVVLLPEVPASDVESLTTCLFSERSLRAPFSEDELRGMRDAADVLGVPFDKVFHRSEAKPPKPKFKPRVQFVSPKAGKGGGAKSVAAKKQQAAAKKTPPPIPEPEAVAVPLEEEAASDSSAGSYSRSRGGRKRKPLVHPDFVTLTNALIRSSPAHASPASPGKRARGSSSAKKVKKAMEASKTLTAVAPPPLPTPPEALLDEEMLLIGGNECDETSVVVSPNVVVDPSFGGETAEELLEQVDASDFSQLTNELLMSSSSSGRGVGGGSDEGDGGGGMGDNFYQSMLA